MAKMCGRPCSPRRRAATAQWKIVTGRERQRLGSHCRVLPFCRRLPRWLEGASLSPCARPAPGALAMVAPRCTLPPTREKRPAFQFTSALPDEEGSGLARKETGPLLVCRSQVPPARQGRCPCVRLLATRRRTTMHTSAVGRASHCRTMAPSREQGQACGIQCMLGGRWACPTRKAPRWWL